MTKQHIELTQSQFQTIMNMVEVGDDNAKAEFVKLSEDLKTQVEKEDVK